MPQALTQQLRARLLQELEHLQQDIFTYLASDHASEYTQLLSQLQKHPLTHWPDLMKKWLTPELNEKRQRLELVQAALSQMDMGLFGLCSDCECRIDRALLQQDPARQRCEQCQAAYLTNAELHH